jgi:aspartate aminotransferase
MAAYEPIKERTLTVNGVAKGFAMTGWRIGYLAGPKWIVDACSKIQGQFTSGANSIAQYATIAAMQEGKTLAKAMIEAYKSRRSLVHKLLSDIPGFKVNEPKGAFYFFPDVSDLFGKKHSNGIIQNDIDFCNYLLEEALVGVVPGVAFGNDQCIRISYATSEEILSEAMQRIKKAVEKLK